MLYTHFFAQPAACIHFVSLSDRRHRIKNDAKERPKGGQICAYILCAFLSFSLKQRQVFEQRPECAENKATACFFVLSRSFHTPHMCFSLQFLDICRAMSYLHTLYTSQRLTSLPISRSTNRLLLAPNKNRCFIITPSLVRVCSYIRTHHCIFAGGQ